MRAGWEFLETTMYKNSCLSEHFALQSQVKQNFCWKAAKEAAFGWQSWKAAKEADSVPLPERSPAHGSMEL